MASSVLTKTVALRHSLSLPSSSFLSKSSWRQTLSFTSKTFSKPSTALSSSLRSLTIVPELCRLPDGRFRCFATRQASSSLNDPSPNWSNRPPKETILLDGCDFEHWLVVMEPPEGQPTRDEIIDSYIKTLAQIVGSDDEARMKIYSVSTRHYFAFGALVSEELSYKIKALPKVRWVLPDSYLDVKNKDYGGEPFVNGQAVPYDPKYHEEWVRNNQKAQERSRRNDRPRNSDRSRNFDRRRENMQNRDFQRSDMPPPPMPNVPPSNTPPPPPSYQNFNPQNNMPPPPSHQNAPPSYQNPPPGNMPPPSYQNAPPSYQNPAQGNMPPPSYQNQAQGNMPPPNYHNPGQGNMPPPSYQNAPPSYQNPAQGHMPPLGYRNPSPYNNMPPSNYQNPSAQNFQNPNAPPPNFRNPMPPPSYQNPSAPQNYEKPNMQNMPNRDYPGRDKPDSF